MHNKTTDKTINVRYLKDNSDSAVYMASIGGGAVGEHQGNYVDVNVKIRNARTTPTTFNLDTTGFLLHQQQTHVDDFFDDEQIKSQYELELQRLLITVTGARKVRIFDHTRRSSHESSRKRYAIREPASIVHNDYTSNSGVNRLKAIYADNPTEIDELLNSRFAIINIWRSISGDIKNHPIALCDTQSVKSSDLKAVTRQAADRMGELQLARYSPDHQWYYYPRMNINEVLLFKTFDTAIDGTTRFTLHTSFDEGNGYERQSIETRCFVFY